MYLYNYETDGSAMTRMLPISEARKQLTRLPKLFEQEPELGAVAVTRRGQPVLAVMPWELYESMVQTLDIMADDELRAALRRSIREATEGKTIPWEVVKAELDM